MKVTENTISTLSTLSNDNIKDLLIDKLTAMIAEMESMTSSQDLVDNFKTQVAILHRVLQNKKQMSQFNQEEK